VPVSNSAADRAGQRYRNWIESGIDIQRLSTADRKALFAAAQTIWDYRALHTVPMTSVTMGIRSMVQTVRRDETIRPGQRFKRADRILGKLRRFPQMRLSQMEDIPRPLGAVVRFGMGRKARGDLRVDQGPRGRSEQPPGRSARPSGGTPAGVIQSGPELLSAIENA
jgi:hypothetical protein